MFPEDGWYMLKWVGNELINKKMETEYTPYNVNRQHFTKYQCTSNIYIHINVFANSWFITKLCKIFILHMAFLVTKLLKMLKDISSKTTANLWNPLTATSCVKQLKLLLIQNGGDIGCRIYGCHFHFSTQYWVVTPFHLKHIRNTPDHSDPCLIVTHNNGVAKMSMEVMGMKCNNGLREGFGFKALQELLTSVF